MFLKATTNIEAGQELLVKYGPSYWPNFNTHIPGNGKLVNLGEKKTIASLVKEDGFVILEQGQDGNVDSIVFDLCAQVPKAAFGNQKSSILTRMDDGTPVKSKGRCIEFSKTGHSIHLKYLENPVRYQQMINPNLLPLEKLCLWFTKCSNLSQRFHSYSPNLIQNHEDWEQMDIPQQQLHRDYFSGWYLQEKESGGEAFSIFVAIGGDFEIAIQRKSHLSGSSDEILPTEKIKVPHKCILVMHALLRHGGLSGHGRLHVYLSTSNPLDNDGGGGTTCTNFGF